MNHDPRDGTTVSPSTAAPTHQSSVPESTTGELAAGKGRAVSFAESLNELICEENELGSEDESGQVVSTPENQGAQSTSGNLPSPESDDTVPQHTTDTKK